MSNAPEPSRAAVEFDPRHPVVVFPAVDGEDRTEGEAA